MTTDEWRETLLSRLVALEIDGKALSVRMSQIEIQAATDEVHRANVEKRLSSIEDTLKWLVRLIIGALLLGLVAFFAGGGLVL